MSDTIWADPVRKDPPNFDNPPAPPPSTSVGGATTTPDWNTYGRTKGGGIDAAPTPPDSSTGGHWIQVPIDSSWTGTPTGGRSGTGAPPTPTGNSALDQLLAVLSYGGDVYQSIPALQYIMGQISEGQFNTVSTQDTVVPQLGITLPAPGKLNYQMLSNVKQNSPGSFELLKSLFAAGNRDLENEMAITRQSAPLGSAYEPTLVQT